MEPLNSTSLNGSSNGKTTVVLDKEVIALEKHQDTVTSIPTTPEIEKESQQGRKTTPQRKRRLGLIVIGLGVGAAASGTFGYHWWQYASTHVDTDNATAAGHIHQISSRINGTVSDVLVNDNQVVKQGQLLVKLDPRDYENKVAQAQVAIEAASQQAKAANASINLASQNAAAGTTEAQGNVQSAQAAISTAQAAVKEAQAGIPAAQAQVAQAQANLQKAQADYQRYNNLFQQGAIPRQQLDTANAAYQVAQAQKSGSLQQVAPSTS